MGKLLILAGTLALVAACKAEDVLDQNVGDAAPGGSGGSGGACQYDDWSIAMAGAVYELPEVPAAGSWCPRDGIEICTDRGPDAAQPALASDAGPSEPNGVVSRCSSNAWQTVAGATCENTNENCNVFNYREYDGQCCSHLRNCRRGFCDGERWWTRRE